MVVADVEVGGVEVGSGFLAGDWVQPRGIVVSLVVIEEVEVVVWAGLEGLVLVVVVVVFEEVVVVVVVVVYFVLVVFVVVVALAF